MNSYVIQTVSVIASKDIVLINVVGHDRAIIRTTRQFLRELKSSNLLPEVVQSLNHPMVMATVRGLTGGMVAGLVQFHKKGSEYTIEEGHPALTDENHNLYGTVKQGEKIARETDGFYIERNAMLTVVPNQEYERNQAIASAMSFNDSMAAIFAAPAADTSSNSEGVDEATGEIPIVEEPAKKGTAKK